MKLLRKRCCTDASRFARGAPIISISLCLTIAVADPGRAEDRGWTVFAAGSLREAFGAIRGGFRHRPPSSDPNRIRPVRPNVRAHRARQARRSDAIVTNDPEF